MKKYTDFRSEQIHINEIGPVGATIAAVTGLIGGAMALKKGLDKYKGYRETKKEKAANKEGGVFVKIKVFDKNTGKTTDRTEVIAPPGSKKANMSNDEIQKEKKKRQAAQDVKNAKAQYEYETKIKPKQDADADAKKKSDQSKMSAKDWVDTEIKEIPPDMKTAVKKLERNALGGHKDVVKFMQRWDQKQTPKGWKKSGRGKDFEYVKSDSKMENYVLKFGEFIQEDVVSDLKKISKSKKDMEIKLSDGSEIPIDPMTADIFVKYIEGLKSSEQKRVINQIQRTERGFMKVLGKAHGE